MGAIINITERQKSPKKWRDQLWFWWGKLSTEKLIVLPKLIYKFKAISPRILKGFSQNLTS